MTLVKAPGDVNSALRMFFYFYFLFLRERRSVCGDVSFMHYPPPYVKLVIIWGWSSSTSSTSSSDAVKGGQGVLIPLNQ